MVINTKILPQLISYVFSVGEDAATKYAGSREGEILQHFPSFPPVNLLPFPSSPSPVFGHSSSNSRKQQC